MAEHRLHHNLTAEDNGGLLTYGGSQLLSDSAIIKKCGCGVVTAADLFIYLCRYRRGCDCAIFDDIDSRPIPVSRYNEILKTLSRRFFPLIPQFGINGLSLACGINLFFRKYGFPLRAQWGSEFDTLEARVEEMLDSDIPVIIAIGPNLPRFWENNQAGLYVRLSDGNYRRVGSVKAHYATITACDSDWFTISSWGHKYYFSKLEYLRYSRAYSNSLVSNIVYIKPV